MSIKNEEKRLLCFSSLFERANATRLFDQTIEFHLAGHSPQLVQGAGFELPNSFFGHAQFRADFLERERLLAVIQSESADDDLLFAVVQTRKDLADLVFTLLLGAYG